MFCIFLEVCEYSNFKARDSCNKVTKMDCVLVLVVVTKYHRLHDL